MASRLELQEELERILGSRNVYFSPPEAIKMNYPAIVYSLSDIRNGHADNNVYASPRVYLVTLIDKDPDNDTVAKLIRIPTCSFVRFFTSDNLNHWVFTFYF